MQSITSNDSVRPSLAVCAAPVPGGGTLTLIATPWLQSRHTPSFDNILTAISAGRETGSGGRRSLNHKKAADRKSRSAAFAMPCVGSIIRFLSARHLHIGVFNAHDMPPAHDECVFVNHVLHPGVHLLLGSPGGELRREAHGVAMPIVKAEYCH